MLSSMDLIEKTRRYQDYIHALEEERRKIQVFQRELPLCLQLVSQTIENVKNQIESMVSDETSSDGPVLEEFIPLKPSFSSSEEDSAHEVKRGVSMDISEKKADWLQSVQLWNQEPDSSLPPPHVEPPCKPVPVNLRKMGGAFQPFEKEKILPLPTTSAGAASSTAGVSSGAAATSSYACDASKRKDKENEKEKGIEKEKGNDKGNEEESQNNRKPRRCWSPELHKRFLHALQQLGGSHAATPKQIRELMKVDGLTNDEVKSHLQKYRLHTRRPNSGAQSGNNCNQPAPQFVVVGGIWVPPQEYAAAAAAAAAAQPSADMTTRSSKIYTPIAIASVPSPKQHSNKRPMVNESRCNGDADKRPSTSPSTSSSSQTTTASPNF